MPDSTTTEPLRARYMRGEITFHDYYGALIDLIGENRLRPLLPAKTRTPGEHTPADWRRLLATDEHLNNVPLHLWDRRDPIIRDLAWSAPRDQLRAINGTGGWSLGDSVCVLKETARRYAADPS